jgi:hypothetical protein
LERRLDRLFAARGLRYSSPPGMVAAATERRLAGDWRGACAAALLDVHIDLREVTAEYGASEAQRIEADLAGFAPDLLRRFLPWGSAFPVLLTRLEDPLRLADGLLRRLPVLVARMPYSRFAGRFSVALRVADLRTLPARWYDLPSWAWHADAVAARRWAYGASPDRLAWHHADGTPRPLSSPPGQEQDRAAEVERLAVGTPVEAFEAAGFEVRIKMYPRGFTPERMLLAWMGKLPVLRGETARLARRYGQSQFVCPGGELDIADAAGPRPIVQNSDFRPVAGAPYILSLVAPPDVSLLRFGDLHPDELHPLVHEALFPGREQHWRPQAEPPVPSIRVNCGGRLHEVVPVGGFMTTLHHSDEEINRAIARGGPIGGCAAAVRGWLTGQRPIPKPVRKLRTYLFDLAQFGDTDTLLDRLSGGIDSRLRGPDGETLLHWIAHVDHTRMLPLLLDAGLSPQDRDHDGRTPLHWAALSQAEPVMAALVAAGADPQARDNDGRTPADLLAFSRSERQL